MAGFVFEKDLPHQINAIEGVLSALENANVQKALHSFQNPKIQLAEHESQLKVNLENLRKTQDFQQTYTIDATDRILDISMETGTGKTYAYTKTMFELNKQIGIAKFIIAVPRVAIKAGTVSFLKSDAAREHFRDEYGRDIKVYEVKNKKSVKSKKDHFPQAVSNFCRVDLSLNKSAIHVLVINAGMINSKTMSQKFDTTLWDKFNQPFEAIADMHPVLIVDEPHMFKRGNKSYKMMMQFKPQFVLRYGATFDNDLINMVNELTAVDAFNQDLVKGVIAHVENFEEGKNVSLKLNALTGSEAKFELNIGGSKSKHSLTKGESFETIHEQMYDLSVSSMNKSKLILSNNLELSKGGVINPYSYSESLQDKMIKNAIRVHFKTERELFLASPRIKPLTLFFIDNIDSYRDKEGAMRVSFELLLKSYIKGLILKEIDKGYKDHLQKAFGNISGLHGGYFSKDNSDKDEAIENETLEILHEKEKLLNFTNPRRFIFSKWTLREGWDNPNVFTICKLRSSGSETSKLQEVGRGLRLPVNEFMSRDKSKIYYLNYFVDFTEEKFIDTLVSEINSKSQVPLNSEKLDEVCIKRLLSTYDEFEDDEGKLLETLDDLGIIKRNNDYKEGGYEKLKATYPNAFNCGLKDGKIKKDSKDKTKATIRPGKYDELKLLWEQLNKKVILEYKCDDAELVSLFEQYLRKNKTVFSKTGSKTETYKIQVNGKMASKQTSASETYVDKFIPMRMMSYQDFLKSFSSEVGLNMQNLHNVFCKLKDDVNINININSYLSHATIRSMRMGFNDYLMQNVFCKFQIGYCETSNQVHPTKFTDIKGKPYKEIDSGDVGIYPSSDLTHESYLFDQIFYDGKLELCNIKTNIDEVVVYSKIPKNSIRIPLVGGGSYSPDFAYVIKTKDGKSLLNLIVETKGKDEINLNKNEIARIKHAETYFGKSTKIIFKTQLQNMKIKELIEEALNQ